MKKHIVFLTVIFILLAASLGANAVELKDVPKSHWAYQSVNKLVNKGFLSLYKDGTFRGKDKVSRYEMAELVARILKDIQDGKVEASEEDIDILRKLSLEFRDELVELAKKQDIFAEQIKQVQQKNLIQNEDIGKVNERLSSIESDVTQIIDNILKIKQLEENLNKLDAKIVALEREINQTNVKLDKKNEELRNLKTELDNSSYQNLEDQQSVNLTKTHLLQGKISELENDVISSQTEIRKLKEESKSYKMYLAGVALLALVLGA